MRTLKETALGPLRHRLLLYWLAQTTVHVTENCGRFSGYHDDGWPMICNRRAGHLGPWHFDSLNGLVWRSGEEPRPEPDLLIIDDLPGRPGHSVDVSRWLSPTTVSTDGVFVGDPEKRLSTLQREARDAGCRLDVALIEAPKDGTVRTVARPHDIEEWQRARDAFGDFLMLEQRITAATDLIPDAYTYPGADGTSTINSIPIIDGARPGVVFYTKEPHHEQS